MIKLYQPEKYKVYTGGGNVGFCTSWNEPELIFNKSEIIREKTAILGTLYSQQGVNVILRNLALNPQIRKIFLWGNGLLSNTQFGVLGSSILKKVWENGLEKDGTVRGTQFKIEKEISSDVVAMITENVAFIDISAKSLKEVEDIVKTETDEQSAYMDPVSFPDAALEVIDIFPSENIGWLLRGRKILEVWSRVVDRIMRYGTIKGTQYGYQQRELIGVTWVIGEENPDSPDLSLAADWPQELRQITGANNEGIKEYQKFFLSPELPPGISYTYGNRLLNYSGENGKYLNQIKDVIIKQLKDSPDSRRAVATTMIPLLDAESKEPPCIIQVQALQSRGRLNLLVTARSHDIFKAAIPNAFGLRALQKYICEETNFEIGQLQITSQSAHIYEQDWENALRFVRCMFWERTPSFNFNPMNADPRGSVIISLEKAKIMAEIQGLNGLKLVKLEGGSANEIAKKIAHLELLSRSDHLLDIGIELEKAEIALKLDVEYRQDRPLIF